MKFDLYLESGPQRRTTMVHVMAVPGCFATGPTTDEAIANAPAAIRARIAFLARHGETVADPEPIEVSVAEHVISTESAGFAQAFFEPDAIPLEADEARRQVRIACWSREELLQAAHAQAGDLQERPATGGRAVTAILHHVADAERGYLASVLGPVPGLNAAMTAVEHAGSEPWEALTAARALIVARLAAMTTDELALVVQRGSQTRSTRRMLRRLLEHEWEHVLELQARLEG